MMTVQSPKKSIQKANPFPSKQTLLAKALQASIGVMTAAALCVPLPSLAQTTGNETGGIVEIPNDAYTSGNVIGYDYGDPVSGVNKGSVIIGIKSDEESGSEAKDGTVSGNVYGGYHEVSYTNEDIEEGETVHQNVTVSGSSVTIGNGDANGTVSGNVYGGFANVSVDNSTEEAGKVVVSDVTVSNNTVTIGGDAGGSGAVLGSGNNVYGGYANANYTNEGLEEGETVHVNVSASGNSVTINENGSVANGDVYGGYAKATVDEVNTDENAGQLVADVAVSNNTVTINDNGKVSYSRSSSSNITNGGERGVFGGYSDTGDVTGNAVVINKVNESESAELEKVTVSSTFTTSNSSTVSVSESSGRNSGSGYSISNITSGVFGGYSDSGNVERNSVTVNENGELDVSLNISATNHVYANFSDGVEEGRIYSYGGSVSNVTSGVFGGYSDSGDVTGNTVAINKGGVVNVSLSIDTSATISCAGDSYSCSGTDALNNMYTGSGSVSNVKVGVFGGYSNSSGAVTSNAVTINGGTVTFSGDVSKADLLGVFGGYSDTGDVTSNTVSVTNDGLVGASVYGGYSNGSEDSSVADNVVTIKNSTIEGTITGGYSSDSDVTGNKVTITGDSTEAEAVYGGQSKNGAATSNTVTLSGGSIAGDVYGGLSSGDATSNTVTLSGGSIAGDVVGGQSSSGAATGNTVTLSSGSIEGNVYGGQSSGDATSNTVTLKSGSIASNIYGGQSSSGDAISNTVTISGGEAGGDIYGGQASNGAATDNTVTFTGGTIGTSDTPVSVYAGYGSSAENVSNNTINLSGTVDSYGNLIAAADTTYSTLYGSNYDATGENGNTLNISRYIGKAQNIGHFDAINVNLTGLDLGQANAILTLTGSEPTDLSNSTVKVSSTTNIGGLFGVAETKSKLAKDYTIIANENGVTTNDKTSITEKLTVVQNGSLYSSYALSTDTSGGVVYVKDGETQVVPGTDIFPAHRLATASFLNEAIDFALDRKLQCSVREDGSMPDVCFYGAISGGELHHDLNGEGNASRTTGTHWYLGVRGKMNDRQDTAKDINAALWVEAGWGDVDSHTRWAQGSGNTHYYGIGVLGEYRQKEGILKGSYAQVHARVGRAFDDMESSLRSIGSGGRKMGYDEDMTYYGAGLDFGYEWAINSSYMLDTSVKYRWLHLEGFDSNIAGEDYKLDDIDSHRTKLGTRLNYTGSKIGTPYIGIAWEHEFSGNSRGEVSGYSLEGSSLKGDTGVLEMGAKFKPSEKSPWDVNFLLEGYMGQKEGVMGNLTVNYQF